MERQYLFNSTDEFFESPVWEGDRFYDAEPYRPWFGWIYISLFKHIPVEDYKEGKADVPIKIGHSTNVFRRNKELFSDAGDQKASSIVYVWSVPLCVRFESDLKTLMTAYIMPERSKDQTGRSEIVWGIPLIPLISMVQLSILKTCLHMRYIKSDMVFTLRPPDTITEQGKVYPGKHRYMVPHELDIDETFAQFNLEEPDNPIKVKDYIFVKDKRTPLESSPTHDKPEIEGEYLTYSDAKVYKIGTYVYAKYTRRERSFELAKIIGYGKRKSQRYAVRWLETIGPDKVPIQTDDPDEPLQLTDDRWEFVSEDVIPIATRNKKLFNKLIKDIDEVKVGIPAKVSKLRM